MEAEKIIIVSGLAAGGLKFAADWPKVGGTPDAVRVVAGTFVLIALLLLIANFWPDGARALAVAVLVTSVAMNGGDFFKLISSLVD